MVALIAFTEDFELTSSSTGKLQATYDEAGNLVNMTVDRSSDTCANQDNRCSPRFVYDWDEIGTLLRVRRWDFTSLPGTNPYPDVPPSTPTIDAAFTSSASARVLKSTQLNGGPAVHDVQLFDTLMLRGADFQSDYQVDETTEKISLGPASIHYLPNLPSPSSSSLRTFIELSDGVGNTAVVIDRETSELVERRNSQAFGKEESDYRPTRWTSFHDPIRFQSKIDDTDLGLINFGARYYQPAGSRKSKPGASQHNAAVLSSSRPMVALIAFTEDFGPPSTGQAQLPISFSNKISKH